MKRKGFLYQDICSMDNLILADHIARAGKAKQPGVIKHDKTRGCNLLLLFNLLQSRSYKVSPYKTFIVHDPKEREIFMLPYFPDRITQHAIMNVLEPIFEAVFTADTYSSIKGRGLHSQARKIKNAMKDKAGTQYCLKLDVRKFYPQVNHDILKQLLRKKFKDNDLLCLPMK